MVGIIFGENVLVFWGFFFSKIYTERVEQISFRSYNYVRR